MYVLLIGSGAYCLWNGFMYINLFRIFFKIGFFTLGGGYAMIPVSYTHLRAHYTQAPI